MSRRWSRSNRVPPYELERRKYLFVCADSLDEARKGIKTKISNIGRAVRQGIRGRLVHCPQRQQVQRCLRFLLRAHFVFLAERPELKSMRDIRHVLRSGTPNGSRDFFCSLDLVQ